MDFFNTIFDGLVGLSEKLPALDIGVFYIVVITALGVVAIVIGLTFCATSAFKVKRAAGKVLSYLENEDSVTDDNVADFTATCFGAKAPAAMREAWVSYLGVRFGYPGEVLSEAVFDKEVKRPDSVRANVYIAVALILTALFSFWGLGSMKTSEVGVVLCLGLLVAAVGYLVLWLVARREYAAARKKFLAMQDELDAKVNLQVERDYATDASPLLEVAAVMDGIVARNTAKPAPTEEEVAALVAARAAAAAHVSADEADAAAPAEGAEDDIVETAPAADDGEDKTPLELAAEEAAPVSAEETVSEESAEDAGESVSAPADEEGKGRDTVAEEIEEINDEDEESMFGRKKKKLQNAELTARGYGDLDVEVEGELLPDDDGADAIEATLVAAPAPEEPYAAPVYATGMARGSEPESLEGLNIARRPVADASVTVSLEPEVIYVEEDLDEGDEDVKPPRLAKLPHLVDYVLTMNLSRSMKIRVAMLMLQAYNVFKNSPENKAIVIQCLTKIMKVLMADHAAAQAAKAKAEQEAAAAAAADSAAE